MDICITDFQSEDALDFILAMSCLGGLMDECVGEAMCFGLSQVCTVVC